MVPAANILWEGVAQPDGKSVLMGVSVPSGMPSLYLLVEEIQALLQRSSLEKVPELGAVVSLSSFFSVWRVTKCAYDTKWDRMP